MAEDATAGGEHRGIGEDRNLEPSRRRLVLHPVLFAAFPVVYLWARNTSQGITPGDVIRPLAVVLAGVAVVWVLATLALA